MRNILLALSFGALVFSAVFIPGLLRFRESLAPAIFVVFVAYFVLARRTFKKVEVLFMQAQGALTTMPPNISQAIATMEQAYPYARHQIGIRSQVDTQIGVIHFLQQDFGKALPLLKRSMGFGHWLGAAMLGVIYYKRKDYESMHRTFVVVIKRGKKQGLAWTLYAYLLSQIGEHDRARSTLVAGLKATKDDDKVKEALLALQNGKKIKMKVYKEQWYQFHLERPPAAMAPQPIGMKGSKAALRGRW